VKTMLRLAKSGTTIRIVDDQIGSPTYALDLAETIIDLCASWSKLRLNGLFHVTGTGETSWFGFACQIFQSSTRQGGPLAAVQPVRTVEFPTMAIRPANSRLDCTRFQDATGIRLPQWRDATDRCVARLLSRPEVED
jgi:dTDP-4-dehydrorhamnose reductase